jgi:hypothetical protein
VYCKLTLNLLGSILGRRGLGRGCKEELGEVEQRIQGKGERRGAAQLLSSKPPRPYRERTYRK